MLIVPFFSCKLDMSFLLGCGIIPSFSGHSFIKSPISILLTKALFDIWGKVGKVCLEMFRNFEVALNVTKNFSTPDILHELFFAERTFIGEICSKMSFYCRISSVKFPPVALPHFKLFSSVLLYIFFAHLVFFPLFYPSRNFVIIQCRASFLTWTVVEITTHCLKGSVTRVTNSINSKAINLLLSAGCNIAFNATFRMNLLKLGKDHFFERACFVLSGIEFLRFSVIVPSCIQSNGHWLTHRKGIELACVYADD